MSAPRSRLLVSNSPNLRVGAGVGHREETRAVVLLDEVLIGEPLAIDGSAAGALNQLATVQNIRLET